MLKIINTIKIITILVLYESRSHNYSCRQSVFTVQMLHMYFKWSDHDCNKNANLLNKNKKKMYENRNCYHGPIWAFKSIDR